PWLPVVRALARLAHRPRIGRRARACPRGAGAGGVAAAEGCIGVRRALVLQGSGVDACGDARHRRATARGRPRGHRRARRGHRPRLAPDGPQGGSRGDDATPPQPRPARVSGWGMVVIRGGVEREVGELLMQALAAAREALYRQGKANGVLAGTSVVDGSPDAPTMEQQQADALALVAETALHRGMD